MKCRSQGPSSCLQSVPLQSRRFLPTPVDRRQQRLGRRAVTQAGEICSHVAHFDLWESILVSHISILDASINTMTTASTDATQNSQDNGWLEPLVFGLESILRYLQSGLDRFNVPYSYGWSIVSLTALVKIVTFPLTKTQVESTMSMQALKPQIDMIKEKYGENKDAIQRETSALYEKANVNPLAGCLPTLATIPIFIGLYRSLTSVASQGDLDNQGFYWIPSLAGPTTIAAQKAGAGTAWLFPFVDGAPPIGWEVASSYLVLPVALVAAQYISSAIISPPVDPNSDSAKFQKALYVGLPLMVGWFSLNLPAGLSLYYFSNTAFTSGQQIFLRKLGGAKLAEYDLGPIELGKARRTGETADSSLDMSSLSLDDSVDISEVKQSLSIADKYSKENTEEVGQLVPAAAAFRPLDRRSKRKKL